MVGLKVATWASTSIGRLRWVAGIDLAFNTYGAIKATNNLSQSYQDNGKFELEDTWNLLAYVPFAGSLLGVKQFLSASKAVKGSTESVDGLMTAQKTVTKTRNCFVAGTEILTTEGIKNIEDIQVGDWVIADDPTTVGEIEAKQVLDTFVRHTTALVDIYIDGEIISTTGEHPFWTPDLGWVEAKDLHVGSLLQTEDGRIIDVDGVDKREGDFTVYNFKVEGFHTYFVSDLGILVHNADCEDVAKLYKREMEGGMRVQISSKNGEFLKDPKDSGWFNHTVFVKKGMVYDPMGMGDLGGVDVTNRLSLNWRDFDRFDANPTPWRDWLEAYGGREGLNFKIDRSSWGDID